MGNYGESDAGLNGNETDLSVGINRLIKCDSARRSVGIQRLKRPHMKKCPTPIATGQKIAIIWLSLLIVTRNTN